MGDQSAALDETQYSNPAVLAYWQGVHANSVHGYFSESPFFDHTTKNGVLWGQALNDPNTLALYSDRQRLEQTLRQRPGIEYMIVGDPQPVQDQTFGPDTGVYVIRKQDRVKRPPRDDELTTLGTYYVAGPNIYQAPSVYDVVGNHLLSAMTSLSKFMDQAAPLPIFNPAVGYTWFPPAAAKSTKTAAPSSSREGSVGPDQSASQRAGSVEPSARSSSAVGSSGQAAFDPRDTLLLEHSFRLALAHGDEYMDENPLRGEPGNFVFTHTKDHIRNKQAQAEAAAAKAREREAAEKAKAAVPAAFSTKPKEESVPPNIAGSKRKGSKADGKKRRKSRVAMSPTSPSATGTPSASAMASPEAT
ncbi:Mediator of RNA polymerase II transcription subunit 6 [Elsinoe australis]|uniref:Mediator of RNA polymerase II transcription subunit 6 n=1 Tax=Elsinoe australis TaxID=40998 RepID=A0A2P7Z929_9PEZI|nr:Mediator of RNA polymerase II transcription subunit 6 [Elsinoe australis]